MSEVEDEWSLGEAGYILLTIRLHAQLAHRRYIQALQGILCAACRHILDHS